jgi:hypothetical protein
MIIKTVTRAAIELMLDPVVWSRAYGANNNSKFTPVLPGTTRRLPMTDARKIEIFSAGCPLCSEAEDKIRELTCSSCEITVLSLHEPASLARARELGVQCVPAVAIDGRLADCCRNKGIDEAILKDAGIGKPIG